MATLVTGGNGFIGSNVVKLLAERGHQVISLDIAEPDNLVHRYLEPLIYRVVWVQADILDAAALERAVTGYRLDRIVHAAVYTAVQEDLERAESRRIIDINLVGTANLLEVARKSSARRFVYISSGGVYGTGRSPSEPLKEDTPLDPDSLYGITKYASELITRRYGALHRLETASIRLSGPYGPMERVTGHRAAMSSMYHWTAQAVRGEPVEIAPRGTSGDLTYVLDIANGIATILDAPALHYRVYNLSSGRIVSLGELREAFRAAVPAVKIALPSPGREDATGFGYGRGPLDTTRIRTDLGFAPRYDLASGVREYINWRRANEFLA
ncbi:MAG: SDR family NAD(P)-dependent oxidoreductase [Chloroflexi bacterium]|nr:SDR family NAD(P)-dependent oxidoreductase [Chloroflexota bacterium]